MSGAKIRRDGEAARVASPRRGARAFTGRNLALSLQAYVGMMTTATALDREAAIARYVSLRERTEALFDSVRPEAYESRPILLRNPICFYEGHLPAFSVNTLLKKGLGDAGIDPDYEVLFERGIDPEDEKARPA